MYCTSLITMMSNLVPTVVTDRNGKLTTVYKKPATASFRSLIRMPSVEKTAGRRHLIEAIKVEVDSLRSYKGLAFPTNGIPTNLLHGVLEIFSSDTADETLVAAFEETNEQIKDKKSLIGWVEGMTTYGPQIMGFASNGKFADGVTTGRHIAALLHSRDTGISNGMSEVQELALIELFQASSGTELTGNIFHRPTAYGLALYHDSQALTQFVRNHPDEETLKQAVMLVLDRKVRRVEELESFASREVPGNLIEGIL